MASLWLDFRSGLLLANKTPGAMGVPDVGGAPAATSPSKNRPREGGVLGVRGHSALRLGVGAVVCLLVTSVVVRVQRLAFLCPPPDASTTVRTTPKKNKDSFLREMEDLETNLTLGPNRPSGAGWLGFPPFAAWSHTPEGHDVCASFVPVGSSTAPDNQHLPAMSPSMVWHLLSPAIVNASYFPSTYANDTHFQHWVQDMFGFYTTDRLRRSVAHPPSNQAMKQILRLVANRRNDPTTHEPIRILVLGGSVTQGRACTANSIGLPEAFWMYPQLECAWPARFEHLLNHAFFQGQPVFEVRNLAVGGSNSEVGAMVLEYQLLPDLHDHIPHIIMSSYSANDAQDPDPHATFHIHQQALVKATQRLRPCNDDLPLLVMVDDLFADIPSQAIEQTGSLYKIAAWYKAMAIAYSNVARHQVVAHHTFNATGTAIPNPLLGTPFNTVHLGMGFHIGLAWTVLFNFVTAFQETCSSADPGASHGDEAVGDPSQNTDLNIGTSVSNDAATPWVEWPTKDRGPIGTTTSQIRAEWLDNRARRNERCQAERLGEEEARKHAGNGTTAAALVPTPSPYSTPVCAYAWMVNRQTSIYETKHVNAALKPVLLAQNGWAASGYPIRQPRTGYYASEANATFELELRDLSQDAKSLTILSMKSYGPTWVGSKLRLRVSVMRKAKGDSATAAEATYEIDGYHAVTTSVHFPHKFPVPGDGAKPGDTIRVNATLVSGSTFKIAGLAFCQY